MVILQVARTLDTWHSELDFVKALLKWNKVVASRRKPFLVYLVFFLKTEIFRGESNHLCFVSSSRLECCLVSCSSSSTDNKKSIVCMLTGNPLHEGEEDVDLETGYDFWVCCAPYLVLSLLLPVCEENSLSSGLLCSSHQRYCSTLMHPPSPRLQSVVSLGSRSALC